MITKPMLAVSAKNLNDLKFPLLATPKLDGIRCLVVGGKALSRKFKPIPNHHVRNWIEKNCPDGFDGEIMCPKKTFNETQSLIMTEEGEPDFTYWVFDYVKNNVSRPYEDRINDLFNWIETSRNMTNLIILIPTLIPDQMHLLIYENEQIDYGYEGVMVRTPDSPYKNGRSTLKESYLLKIKRFEDAEAIVLGFEEKMHNNNEATKDELGRTKRSSHKANLEATGTLGSLLVKDIKTNVEFSIGTGFDDKTRSEIWLNRDIYLNRLVTYQFQPSGMKDKPRFPSFKGFRDPRDM